MTEIPEMSFLFGKQIPVSDKKKLIPKDEKRLYGNGIILPLVNRR